MSNNTAKSIEECVEEVMRSDEEYVSIFASEEELQEGKAHIDGPSDYRLLLSWNRTPTSAKKKEENTQILFIGMNPSSATKFTAKEDGGDPTTEILRQLFAPSDSEEYISSLLQTNSGAKEILDKADRVTIINLHPVINGKSSNADATINSIAEDRNEIIRFLTKIVFTNSVDIFHERNDGITYIFPIWGERYKYRGKKYWKTASIKKIVQDLNFAEVTSIGGAIYVPNKYDKFPVHPGHRNWGQHQRSLAFIQEGWHRIFEWNMIPTT